MKDIFEIITEKELDQLADKHFQRDFCAYIDCAGSSDDGIRLATGSFLCNECLNDCKDTPAYWATKYVDYAIEGVSGYEANNNKDIALSLFEKAEQGWKSCKSLDSIAFTPDEIEKLEKLYEYSKEDFLSEF